MLSAWYECESDCGSVSVAVVCARSAGSFVLCPLCLWQLYSLLFLLLLCLSLVSSWLRWRSQLLVFHSLCAAALSLPAQHQAPLVSQLPLDAVHFQTV